MDRSAKIVLKVSIVTIIVNLLLVAIKVIFGAIYGNLAVLSDAVHSASDLMTSFVIILAVLMSSPKRDKKHNYGHEKVEPLVTLFIALIIGGVGVMLGWKGIEGLISPATAEINYYLISVVLLTIIIKEAMFWYEIYYAKMINSAMLRADAWHSRSDSLSSVAVLIGLCSAWFMRTNILESIAVIIVSLFIIKVAFDIMKPAVDNLLDRAAGEQACVKIKEITLSVDGVKQVDSLNTRVFGNSIYVDIEIAVDKDLSVEESHKIAETVHDILEAEQSLYIKHCMVHVHPFEKVPATYS